MAVSDQLTKLAARAKEAEDHAAAAQSKASADLEKDVEAARTSAQAQADKLRATAEEKKGKLSVWWYDVQRSWDEHIERITTSASCPWNLSTEPTRAPAGSASRSRRTCAL